MASRGGWRAGGGGHSTGRGRRGDGRPRGGEPGHEGGHLDPAPPPHPPARTTDGAANARHGHGRGEGSRHASSGGGGAGSKSRVQRPVRRRGSSWRLGPTHRVFRLVEQLSGVATPSTAAPSWRMSTSGAVEAGLGRVWVAWGEGGQDASDENEQHEVCPVCLDAPCKAAVVTPCGHVMCAPCLWRCALLEEDWLTTAGGGGSGRPAPFANHVACPVCHAHVPLAGVVLHARLAWHGNAVQVHVASPPCATSTPPTPAPSSTHLLWYPSPCLPRLPGHHEPLVQSACEVASWLPMPPTPPLPWAWGAATDTVVPPSTPSTPPPGAQPLLVPAGPPTASFAVWDRAAARRACGGWMVFHRATSVPPPWAATPTPTAAGAASIGTSGGEDGTLPAATCADVVHQWRAGLQHVCEELERESGAVQARRQALLDAVLSDHAAPGAGGATPWSRQSVSRLLRHMSEGGGVPCASTSASASARCEGSVGKGQPYVAPSWMTAQQAAALDQCDELDAAIAKRRATVDHVTHLIHTMAMGPVAAPSSPRRVEKGCVLPITVGGDGGCSHPPTMPVGLPNPAPCAVYCAMDGRGMVLHPTCVVALGKAMSTMLPPTTGSCADAAGVVAMPPAWLVRVTQVDVYAGHHEPGGAPAAITAVAEADTRMAYAIMDEGMCMDGGSPVPPLAHLQCTHSPTMPPSSRTLHLHLGGGTSLPTTPPPSHTVQLHGEAITCPRSVLVEAGLWSPIMARVKARDEVIARAMVAQAASAAVVATHTAPTSCPSVVAGQLHSHEAGATTSPSPNLSAGRSPAMRTQRDVLREVMGVHDEGGALAMAALMLGAPSGGGGGSAGDSHASLASFLASPASAPSGGGGTDERQSILSALKRGGVHADAAFPALPAATTLPPPPSTSTPANSAIMPSPSPSWVAGGGGEWSFKRVVTKGGVYPTLAESLAAATSGGGGKAHKSPLLQPLREGVPKSPVMSAAGAGPGARGTPSLGHSDSGEVAGAWGKPLAGSLVSGGGGPVTSAGKGTRGAGGPAPAPGPGGGSLADYLIPPTAPRRR